MKRIFSHGCLHSLLMTFGALLFFPTASPLAQTGVRSAQTVTDVVTIPQTLRAENCPPVSRALKNEYDSHLKSYYLESVTKVLSDADSGRPVILVKEMNNPVRFLEYRLNDSVATLNVKQEIPVLDTIYDLYPSPDGSLYLFNADDFGDGQYQFYLYNPKSKKSIRVISEGRNVEPVWSPDGKKIAYGNALAGQEGMSLAVAELVTGVAGESQAKIRLVTTTKFMLTAQDWSSDGNYLAYIEYFSNRNSSALWLLDLKTEEKIFVSPFGGEFETLKIQTKEKDVSDLNFKKPNGEVTAAQFSPDGKKLYFAANHEGDFVRLYSYDLSTRQMTVVVEKNGFDIENFRLSATGKKVAVVFDVDGASRLFVTNPDGSQSREATLPAAGLVENLAWSEDDKFLAFNFASAEIPAAIMYVEPEGRKKPEAKLVASSPAKLVADLKLPKAEPIAWKADDGLLLKGWMFKAPQAAGQPDSKQKRPVIVDIHGGPEDSARPEYPETDIYYLNALGAAVIYPNVRGSTGRGKSFLDADNGLKRGDAVKDFGKLFEWIAVQPDLDANRVMLRGFSYGGYMALLVAATYPKAVSAVAVESAPTNLVTFLETTSGWRRAQRRNEYGDERDPKFRDGLEKIAPRNLTSNLRMPLLVAAGMRDPRVPAAESEKFISAIRAQGNKNVWSLFASDDGHGLTGENDEYRSLLAAEFFKKFVAGKRVKNTK